MRDELVDRVQGNPQIFDEEMIGDIKQMKDNEFVQRSNGHTTWFPSCYKRSDFLFYFLESLELKQFHNLFSCTLTSLGSLKEALSEPPKQRKPSSI